MGPDCLPSRGRRLVEVCRVAARGLLDLAYPRECPACGHVAPASEEFVGVYCTACWGRIERLQGSACDRCGEPGPGYPRSGCDGPVWRCGRCAATPPAFARALAAGVYDEPSGMLRDAILRLKHGGEYRLAEPLSELLLGPARALYPDPRAVTVVPVPLHRWRRWARGFNQAELLARGLVARWPPAVFLPVLARRRATRPQQGSPPERARNVRGAFRLRGRYRSRAGPGSVLLVDDVLTTGATASECAEVLLQAGATTVKVAVLARAFSSPRLAGGDASLGQKLVATDSN